MLSPQYLATPLPRTFVEKSCSCDWWSRLAGSGTAVRSIRNQQHSCFQENTGLLVLFVFIDETWIVFQVISSILFLYRISFGGRSFKQLFSTKPSSSVVCCFLVEFCPSVVILCATSGISSSCNGGSFPSNRFLNEQSHGCPQFTKCGGRPWV